MSKTHEELNKLKEEVKTASEKLRELSPEELEQVTGGVINFTLLRTLMGVVFESPDTMSGGRTVSE